MGAPRSGRFAPYAHPTAPRRPTGPEHDEDGPDPCGRDRLSLLMIRDKPGHADACLPLRSAHDRKPVLSDLGRDRGRHGHVPDCVHQVDAQLRTQVAAPKPGCASPSVALPIRARHRLVLRRSWRHDRRVHDRWSSCLTLMPPAGTRESRGAGELRCPCSSVIHWLDRDPDTEPAGSATGPADQEHHRTTRCTSGTCCTVGRTDVRDVPRANG